MNQLILGNIQTQILSAFAGRYGFYFIMYKLKAMIFRIKMRTRITRQTSKRSAANSFLGNLA